VLREGRRVVPGWHEALRLQVKWQCKRQHSPVHPVACVLLQPGHSSNTRTPFLYTANDLLDLVLYMISYATFVRIRQIILKLKLQFNPNPSTVLLVKSAAHRWSEHGHTCVQGGTLEDTGIWVNRADS
jgi:hypothetical protein